MTWKALLAKALEFLTSLQSGLGKLGYIALGIMLELWRDKANEGADNARDVEEWDGNERRLRTPGDDERERLRKLSGKK